jgi:hypothetical protein
LKRVGNDGGGTRERVVLEYGAIDGGQDSTARGRPGGDRNDFIELMSGGPSEHPFTRSLRAPICLVQGKLARLLARLLRAYQMVPKGFIETLKGVQVKRNELQNQYKRECPGLDKTSVILLPTVFNL